MVGSTGTLLTMRLVRSKLRKRDESSISPVNVESQQNVHQTEQQTTPVTFRQNPSSVWVFPPLPPQPNICYAGSQDALVHTDKAGLKNLKKQLGGRFKRFVTKKHEPAPVIPPELKPQLKTIYVY